MAEHSEIPKVPSEKNVDTLRPFRHFCQRILPAVYDDSLSYYELLCKVTHYLNETMSNVNELNEGYNDLYEWCVQLQTWVDTYFDNLDVQEEINNKLDQMAENGQLQELVNNIFKTLEQEMDDFRTEVNERLTRFQNTLGAINVNPPVFVAETGDMTDTSKIYVLTTNGHIWSYNGSSWVDSGLVYVSSTDNVRGYGYSLNEATATSPYDDLNTAPTNFIYAITQDNAVKNMPPNSRQGLVLSYSNNSERATSITQVFMDSRTMKIYTRGYWGTSWSEWDDGGRESMLHRYDVNVAGSDYDLNTIGNNVVATITNAANVKNVPEGSISGTVYSFSGIDSQVGTGQIYFEYDLSSVYVRNCWQNPSGTVWRAWKKLKFDDGDEHVYTEYFNVLTAFDEIVCCGDSLTWSQVYTGQSSSRQAHVTYPEALERLTGATVKGIATAGYSASQWWNAYKDSYISEKSNTLYVVYLGTNGGLTDTIDADCAGEDYNLWSDTNTGAYGKILARINENGAKAVLVKIYASSGSTTTITNSVIDKFAEKFDFMSIPAITLDAKYHTWPNGKGSNGVHLNDFGYAQFASNLIHSISTGDFQNIMS